MARGRLITDFERDFIRIGKVQGVDNATIARALKRTPASICQQVKAMEESGTIHAIPNVAMIDDIADMIRRAGAKR